MAYYLIYLLRIAAPGIPMPPELLNRREALISIARHRSLNSLIYNCGDGRYHLIERLSGIDLPVTQMSRSRESIGVDNTCE